MIQAFFKKKKTKQTKYNMHLTYEICYANRCSYKTMAVFQKGFFIKILPKMVS